MHQLFWGPFDRLLLAGLIVAVTLASVHSQSKDLRVRPRTIVTTDPELDDSNSLVRFMLYSAEVETEGLIFVANTWSASETNFGGRIAFDRDGFLFLTVGERQEKNRAQDPADHSGKVIRLKDDGSVPADNPFVGRVGYMPEIYSLGHRSPQGLTMHPTTGAIWETEHGPLGGDEINIIKPGRNYGWPLVTFGRDYDGTTISDTTSRPDLEPPFIYFVPSLATSGITFYTGDRFPQWKGNAFIGAMVEGRTSGTGHVRRITFNEQRQPIQREPILAELHQRIRDVRQGPDGYLYVLTDEDAGAVLRVEPAQ